MISALGRSIIMKKHMIFFLIVLMLVPFFNCSAQEMLIRNDEASALPQLQSGLPDPGVILGTIGSIYQDNYSYYDTLYDTYLYPKPEPADVFVQMYTTEAQNAGFTADADVVDGYNALRVYPSGNKAVSALLFYDYQGYLLFMVPVSMAFTVNAGDPDPADVTRLVELGNEAIQNQDYEAAIRYLIRAAGSYIRPLEAPAAGVDAAEASPTPRPSGPTTYTVVDGDSCWSIAVDKFGVNFELFMQVNGMTACDIHIGDEVIIPGADQEMATATPIPLDQYTAGQIVDYTVQLNDSYNDIAEKFGSTLDSIQRLNNVNAYTGFPVYGQVLKIEVNLVTPTPTPEPTGTPEPATLEP